ncbi:MAG: amino acid ABC transporter permease [Anaerolineales bacterium]
MTTAATTAVSKEVLPPQAERRTVIGWLRKNLFGTWHDAVLTFLALGIAYALLKAGLTWAMNQARWEVVAVNLRLLLVGQYPSDQAWRVWLCLYLLAGIVGVSWGVWIRGRRRVGVILLLIPLLLAILPFTFPVRLNLVGIALTGFTGRAFGRVWSMRLRRPSMVSWLLYFPLVILIIRGLTPEGGFFPQVGSNLWGGLLLTFLLAVVGIVFSFPIGVILALARQSNLPAIRTLSIAYIETVRGVPLITILFMAQVILPLFLPPDVTLDRVLRAMVGITLFAAAYLAENVRGGLQAIPRGQYDAAYAVGLGGFQTMAFIILPQALRHVIPILVGQFIGLFKDTTLVAIVGLLDLLGIANSVLAQPDFIGLQREVFLFIAAIYWVFSYAMSYASRRLEVALGVGER